MANNSKNIINKLIRDWLCPVIEAAEGDPGGNLLSSLDRVIMRTWLRGSHQLGAGHPRQREP